MHNILIQQDINGAIYLLEMTPLYTYPFVLHGKKLLTKKAPTLPLIMCFLFKKVIDFKYFKMKKLAKENLYQDVAFKFHSRGWLGKKKKS